MKFFNPLFLILGFFTASITANAKVREGLYKVGTKCDIFGKERFEKLRITKVGGILKLLGYNENSSKELLFRTISARTKLLEGGTSHSWAANDSGEKLIITEIYDDRNSSTFRDFGYETHTEISHAKRLPAGDIRITVKRVEHRGPLPDKILNTSCEATFVTNDDDARQVIYSRIAFPVSPKFKPLNRPFVSQYDLYKLNFAPGETTSMSVSYVNQELGEDQLKEIMSLEIQRGSFVPMSSIKLTKVNKTGYADARVVAQEAFKTVIDIVNGNIKNNLETREHYAPFFDHLASLVQAIRDLQSTDKIELFLVQWNEEKSGEGLIILDPESKEILYLGGSGYPPLR